MGADELLENAIDVVAEEFDEILDDFSLAVPTEGNIEETTTSRSSEESSESYD